MPLTKTTQLQAINTMLTAVGESPINSLSAQRADSLIAQNILDEIAREVLTYGWHFNTETNVELLPDESSGFIYIGDKIVRVDTDINYSTNYDIAVRGNRLFNKVDNSYVFSEPIKVIQVYLMDFDEMPEVAKRYITIRAARVFQDRMVGSEKHHAFSIRDETMAAAALTEYETDTGDYTIFDNYDVARTFFRMGSYRVF